MKRVIPLIAFGTFVLLNGSVFSAPIGAYYQVMQAVYARDESTLKYLISFEYDYLNHYIIYIFIYKKLLILTFRYKEIII